MFSLEPLICPCCTPALLHTLAQLDLNLPQQILWLGTGAMSAVAKQYQQTRSPSSHVVGKSTWLNN
ncbi:hypothetical protein [Synechocystis sp. PCC 7509]|uniref:hypothetical protein n=1 Tax=Synechocystis sp. PCC 7509 TaxID=927677 RepID=UPI0002AC5ED4|nr:hypothetical protein [Synechocystis sp. PCC 7509]